MEKPFSAYTGTDDYIFVCYAHRDAEAVYADLVQLNEAGIKIWYDEGIPAGTAWRGEIANAIKGATRFIYFISDASLKSNHCLREVDYALNHDIGILPVYLEEVGLPPELDLALSRVQGLYRDRDARYRERLLAALQDGPVFRALGPVRSNKLLNWGVPVAIVALVLGVRFIYLPESDSLPQLRGGAAATAASQPGSFEMYLEGMGLIERWAQGNNLDNAIDLLQQSVELDPDFALGYARLAEAQRIKYELMGERSWLDAAIENSNKAQNLNPGLVPVQISAGRVQSSQGNYDLASAALERALAIDPNDAMANQALAHLNGQLGRTEEAEALFRKAIALDPDNLYILDDYGNFLNERGRYDEAIQQWQTIVRIAPDFYSVMVNMGSALVASGRMTEAITILERANAIQPTYMAYANLGAAYGGMKRYPESVEALQKALEFNQENWLAWGNIAYAYSWMGGAEVDAQAAFEMAITLAEAAREQNNRDIFVNIDLAVYYAKTNQRELAYQRLDTALALAPESGDVLAAAAEVNEIFGLRELAVEMIRRAIESGYPRHLFFRNPELEELLQTVEF